MKSHLKLALLVLTLVAGCAPAGMIRADDNSSDNQQGNGKLLASLSAQEKIKYLKARRQVLENNADLKTEQEALVKQRDELKSDGTNAFPEERKAMVQNWMAHEKKMKAAMLQVDPMLGPVFDKIDQAIKEKVQEHAAQTGGTTSSGTQPVGD